MFYVAITKRDISEVNNHDVKAKKQKKVGIITREIAIDDDSFEKMGDIPVETIVKQVLANTINKVVKNLENNHKFYRDIEKEVIRESEIFDQNIKLGEKISMIISSCQAKEESLSKKNKYCLEIFRKIRGVINVASADLKLWLLKLCEFFKSRFSEKLCGLLDVLVTKEKLGSNRTWNRAMETNVLHEWKSMDALRTYYTR